MNQNFNGKLEKFISELENSDIKINRFVLDKPWGGYLEIHNDSLMIFLKSYFTYDLDLIKTNEISAKILIIKKDKQFSWQYHLKRSEIWKVIKGSIGVSRSQSDLEGEMQKFEIESIIRIKEKERHRAKGLLDFNIIAELWLHSQGEKSDEEDIIRLADDYNRIS